MTTKVNSNCHPNGSLLKPTPGPDVHIKEEMRIEHNQKQEKNKIHSNVQIILFTRKPSSSHFGWKFSVLHKLNDHIETKGVNNIIQKKPSSLNQWNKILKLLYSKRRRKNFISIFLSLLIIFDLIIVICSLSSIKQNIYLILSVSFI